MAEENAVTTPWSLGWREVVVILFVSVIGAELLVPRAQQLTNFARDRSSKTT